MNLKLQKRPIPFRYPGGKYYALNMLAPYWCYCPHDEYREPFVGGGSVFFSKNKTKHNIINDIDSELITTYKMMQIHKQEKRWLVCLQMKLPQKKDGERYWSLYQLMTWRWHSSIITLIEHHLVEN